MKIQPINSQTSFYSKKKFRIYSDTMEYVDLTSRITFSNNTRWAKEYENPDAEELYKRAKATKDWKEKARLFNEMGHYKMLVYGSGITGLIRRLLDKPQLFM